jgi:hypothetical protein
MKDPVDLQRFKELRKQLNGSNTDTIIIMQIIALVDYMADHIVEQSSELERLYRRLDTLSAEIDNLTGEDNE